MLRKKKKMKTVGLDWLASSAKGCTCRKIADLVSLGFSMYV